MSLKSLVFFSRFKVFLKTLADLAAGYNLLPNEMHRFRIPQGSTTLQDC